MKRVHISRRIRIDRFIRTRNEERASRRKNPAELAIDGVMVVDMLNRFETHHEFERSVVRRDFEATPLSKDEVCGGVAAGRVRYGLFVDIDSGDVFCNG